jgi:tetratricopeptide (TPR) repeat protein
MPDLIELLVVAATLVLTAILIAAPLLHGRPATGLPATTPQADDLDALEIRHRVALDALRDVEADRRSGALDEAAHAAARAEAEAVAARTLGELDAARRGAPPSGVPRPGAPPAAHGTARRALAGVGAFLVMALLVGLGLPPPVGIANRTLDPRRDRIEDALVRFEANPSDPQAISDLSDAYLDGETRADLQRAQAALLLLIDLQPANASAYARLATAQLRTGDLDAADGTLDRMATTAGDSPDLPFLRGLVARERGNETAAREAFEQFVESAPEDPRVPMIRALLEDL